MDAVKAFNSELSALYDVRPPISKAKMTSITRSAIKAIKFYKHVVQSVEKFIQKCKPEYKVPGLYVIDSIVRQSRHQFGSDKDVFAPRFAKNMQNTFANLFNCQLEDKGKIIRVLNLWQKNAVFSPEVIQPLFDQLSDPNNPIHKESATNGLGTVTNIDKTPPNNSKLSSTPGNKVSGAGGDASTPHWLKVAQSQIEAANKAIFELSGVAGLLQQQKNASTTNSLDVLQQLQQLQQFLMGQTSQTTKQDKSSDQVVFDKKLLDYDYDDEDDEENTSPHQNANLDSLNNILQNPEVLKQLTALQQQMTQQQLRQQIDIEEKRRKLQEMKQQEEEFDKHLAQTVPKLPFASECDLKQFIEPPSSRIPDMSIPPPGYQRHQDNDGNPDSEVECIDEDSNSRRQDVEVINLDRSRSSSRSSTRRRRSGSRSRDRRRNKRSRSRSRSRSSSRGRTRRRHRSRSRDKSRYTDRDGDNEKERERKKKGLPPIRRNHLSVCSTTLWIGHLSKLVQQEELSDTFGEFGDIISIDVIPPRGCAFVCMNRRQDAARALSRLKNHKLQGKNITLAWAPGRGVKGREYKDYWEVDLGVSYIPWNKLNKKTDYVELEEGGSLDEDTMPDLLKETIIGELEKSKMEKQQRKMGEDMPVTPSYIPLPEGMPAMGGVMSAPPPPPVLTVPPPVIPSAGSTPVSNSNSTIDTTQPPPNMSPSKTTLSVALSNINAGLPPMMAKPGLVMPPFPFSNLPPPIGLAIPNMIGNLPIGVPPPALLMQQHMLTGVQAGTSSSPFSLPHHLPLAAGGNGPSPQEIAAKLVGNLPFPPPTTAIPSAASVAGVDLLQKSCRLPGHGLQSGHDDSMDLDEEHNEDVRNKSGPEEHRSRGLHGENRDRDKDRSRGDRDHGDRRDRDYRGRSRDRERSRGGGSRNRSREYRGRSRDRDRDRDRGGGGGGGGRDRGSGGGGSSRGNRDGGSKSRLDEDKDKKMEKKVLSPWVEAPGPAPAPAPAPGADDKPNLMERLRSLAENDDDKHRQNHVFNSNNGPISLLNMPDVPPPLQLTDGNNGGGGRQGPPIVINFNQGGPRSQFGSRGPFQSRPDFGPGPGPRRGPFDSFDDEGPGGQRMRLMQDEPRGRFDHPRGMHPDDFPGPGGDDLLGPPMFDDFPHPDDPRMRFGPPRGLMGPMPRGMGPMGSGSGPVPLFGPRDGGMRPLRPVWMDNQGPPPLSDTFNRPPFDDRRRRGGGGGGGGGPAGGSVGPRFRGGREREHTRWSKAEQPSTELKKDEQSTQNQDQDQQQPPQQQNEGNEQVEHSERDTQTPCHDEPVVEHNERVEHNEQIERNEQVEHSERDTHTPVRDEHPVQLTVEGET